MTLHIGIASWQNPEALKKAIQSIEANTQGEYKLLIVDNNSPDPAVQQIIKDAAAGNARISFELRSENVGYVGAVNRIREWAKAEGSQYVAYCDNDAVVRTHGWDRIMMDVLDRNHEVAMVCPTVFGAFPIPRPAYTEILWGVGCFWMLKLPDTLQPPKDIGPWDESLGHQEEVDYQMRLRLEGWKIAGVNIDVYHQAKASTSPEAQDRINNGVIRWMNKWLEYFCGKGITYYSDNVLRFEDWPLNSLHIEAYLQYKQTEGKMPTGFNESPEVLFVEGRKFELIKVPKWPNLYRNRLV